MTKTLIIDLDGTIFRQKPNLSNAILEPMELLPGVLAAFNDWNWKNYKIVLLTGRKESSRAITEKQLTEAGLFWDVLVMGMDAGGQRFLINNLKDNSPEPTAIAINLKQNEGLAAIQF